MGLLGGICSCVGLWVLCLFCFLWDCLEEYAHVWACGFWYFCFFWDCPEKCAISDVLKSLFVGFGLFVFIETASRNNVIASFFFLLHLLRVLLPAVCLPSAACAKYEHVTTYMCGCMYMHADMYRHTRPTQTKGVDSGRWADIHNASKYGPVFFQH